MCMQDIRLSETRLAAASANERHPGSEQTGQTRCGFNSSNTTIASLLYSPLLLFSHHFRLLVHFLNHGSLLSRRRYYFPPRRAPICPTNARQSSSTSTRLSMQAHTNKFSTSIHLRSRRPMRFPFAFSSSAAKSLSVRQNPCPANSHRRRRQILWP